MLIRPADLTDAPALAAVHVASWQWAYRGVVPDEYLDGLDVDRWRARWDRSLAAADPPRQVTLLAERAPEPPVGFIDLVPSRDDAADAGVGEVTSLYVEPHSWGVGVGHALLCAGVDVLREAGYRVATLWVLRDNGRARRFYERAGWARDGAAKDIVVGGSPMSEVRYRRALTGRTG